MPFRLKHLLNFSRTHAEGSPCWAHWLVALCVVALAQFSIHASAQQLYTGKSVTTRPPLPANSVGIDNSYYLDLTTGNVYGPKTVGVWPATPISNILVASSNPTITGNITWSGENAWINTTPAPLISGQLDLAGNSTLPAFTAYGEGIIDVGTSFGLKLTGYGSSTDIGLYNYLGQLALRVPSGTQGVESNFFLANPITVTLSGSTVPQAQGDFVQNITGTSTITGPVTGASVFIGNGSDNASFPVGAYWNELLVKAAFGGIGFSGGRVGVSTFLWFNTATVLPNPNTDNLTGSAELVRASVNAGGVSTGFGTSQFGSGDIWASNPWCDLESGATYWHSCAGEEIDLNVNSGASVANLTGMTVVLTSSHANQGVHADVGYSLGAQNGASAGLRNGFLVGNYNAQWPIDPNGYIFQGIIGSFQNVTPSNAAGGIDLEQVSFTGSGNVGGGFSFRSQGMKIDGSGRGQFGYGLIDGTSGGLVISSTELSLSGTPTIASGGSGYGTNDFVADAYGNIFIVTQAAGVVTSVTPYRVGYVISAPSNPVSVTSLSYHNTNGFGSGLTLNETWTGGANLTLGGNGSGAITIGLGSDTIAVPTVTTGTPVASLCLNSANQIIKKTTTGSCI